LREERMAKAVDAEPRSARAGLRIALRKRSDDHAAAAAQASKQGLERLEVEPFRFLGGGGRDGLELEAETEDGCDLERRALRGREHRRARLDYGLHARRGRIGVVIRLAIERPSPSAFAFDDARLASQLLEQLVEQEGVAVGPSLQARDEVGMDRPLLEPVLDERLDLRRVEPPELDQRREPPAREVAEPEL